MEATPTGPTIILNEPSPPPSPLPEPTLSFSSRRSGSGMSTPSIPIPIPIPSSATSAMKPTSTSTSNSTSNEKEKMQEKPRFITPPPSPSPFMRAFYESQPPPSPTLSRHSSIFHNLRSPISFSLNWRPMWRQTRNQNQISEKPIRGFFDLDSPDIQRRTRKLLLMVFLPTAVIILFAMSIAAGWWSSIYSGTLSRAMSHQHLNDSLGEWIRHAPVPAEAGRKHDRRLSTPTLLVRADTVDSADEPVLSLGNLGSTATTPTPTTSAPSGTLGATSTTRTETTAPAVPDHPVLPTPFVQPFDETISTDFVSGTCQSFFNTFTQDLSFRQCRPFSLLYSDSQGFLSSQTNLTLLTSIIYGTCNTTPSDTDCTAKMDDLAVQLKANCGAELDAGHALTWDAMNGFKNYELYRKAACLRNQRTNAYCFADAVAALQASDVYFWQLPLGTPLPGTQSTSANSAAATNGASGSGSGISITATCSSCTQSLMAIYAQYASNSSLLISKTYSAAERLVDTACGSQYAATVGSGAGRRMSFSLFNPLEGLLALLLVVVSISSML